MENLIVSAGGRNNRLKDFLSEQYSGIPKHILPIPKYNTTILEKIVRDGLLFFPKVTITTNSENNQIISSFFSHYRNVEVVVDEVCNGPLGPMFRALENTGKRVFACAGDYFCDFSWKNFLKFHETHRSGISILISKSIPTKKGARFLIDENNRINSWERLESTNDKDLINIGCYIVDSSPETVAELSALTEAKEDVFFDCFTKKGLMYGFDPGTISFNINTAENYKSLCAYIGKH